MTPSARSRSIACATATPSSNEGVIWVPVRSASATWAKNVDRAGGGAFLGGAGNSRVSGSSPARRTTSRVSPVSSIDPALPIRVARGVAGTAAANAVSCTAVQPFSITNHAEYASSAVAVRGAPFSSGCVRSSIRVRPPQSATSLPNSQRVKSIR